MTLLGIAWRNIRQRLLTSLLTSLSLALGVGLVVATLVTGGIVTRAFESGSGLGYNMIVGAKGSPLQLVLNSVYLVSKPIENISWDFYQQFLVGLAILAGLLPALAAYRTDVAKWL
ncbi:MAG: hypothetical protein EBX36_11400 [Planctomycetia bacterium]|nr:hypothetical protein [Planctomycetia bacterium]